MSKIIKHLELVVITLVILALLFGACMQNNSHFEAVALTNAEEPSSHIQKSIAETIAEVKKAATIDDILPREDIELIALVTMAEAENQPELGQRLVIDTILNRVESGRFGDTVYDVIYAKNQFECMWNGRVDRCEVREDICQLVIEELNNRTNSEVVFFRAGHYHDFGTPVVAVADHYFSTY